MPQMTTVLDQVLRGTSALCGLLRKLGFEERVRGDHHIFYRADVEEILNLQPRGTMAKPYQVRRVSDVIIKYKLGGTDATL